MAIRHSPRCADGYLPGPAGRWGIDPRGAHTQVRGGLRRQGGNSLEPRGGGLTSLFAAVGHWRSSHVNLRVALIWNSGYGGHLPRGSPAVFFSGAAQLACLPL